MLNPNKKRRHSIGNHKDHLFIKKKHAPSTKKQIKEDQRMIKLIETGDKGFSDFEEESSENDE